MPSPREDFPVPSPERFPAPVADSQLQEVVVGFPHLAGVRRHG